MTPNHISPPQSNQLGFLALLVSQELYFSFGFGSFVPIYIFFFSLFLFFLALTSFECVRGPTRLHCGSGLTSIVSALIGPHAGVCSV